MAYLMKGQPEPVGRVKRLRLFPLKSSRAIETDQLECDFWGFHDGDLWDRHWMVTTSERQFVTARQEPRLVLLQPSVDGDRLRIEAPGDQPPISVPIVVADLPQVDTKVHGQPCMGVDCGDEAGEFVSQFLGIPGLRLLTSPQWVKKRAVKNGPTVWHKKAEDSDTIGFQDFSMGSLMNEASLADLAPQLPVPVSADNFRSNIIIEGCPAYGEDEFLEIHVGDSAVFRRLKHTDRCLLTTVDPKTGVKNPSEEPLRSMRKMRMKAGFARPCFCLSLTLVNPGTIKIGDEVKVIKG